MAAGPHVFGPNRRGIWMAETFDNGVWHPQRFSDKLTHVLPRLRNAIPNLTDVFFPPQATADDRRKALAEGFFQHMYVPPPKGKTASQYVGPSLTRHAAQGAGALEYNVEGLVDSTLGQFIRDTHALTRAKKPRLPLRYNVLAYKDGFMPVDLFNTDDQLFLVIQAYGGNMSEVFAPEEIVDRYVSRGIPRDKISVMHAVMCSQAPGEPRQIVMPQIRDRGAYYIDDLLRDAGLLD